MLVCIFLFLKFRRKNVISEFTEHRSRTTDLPCKNENRTIDFFFFSSFLRVPHHVINGRRVGRRAPDQNIRTVRWVSRLTVARYVAQYTVSQQYDACYIRSPSNRFAWNARETPSTRRHSVRRERRRLAQPSRHDDRCRRWRFPAKSLVDRHPVGLYRTVNGNQRKGTAVRRPASRCAPRERVCAP